MRIFFAILLSVFSSVAYSITEKEGIVRNVQVWGSIAKVSVCTNSATSCQDFWVNLNSGTGNSVYSTWLAAKISKETIYIQGYDDRDPSHPYYNSSKFYGMTFK